MRSRGARAAPKLPSRVSLQSPPPPPAPAPAHSSSGCGNSQRPENPGTRCSAPNRRCRCRCGPVIFSFGFEVLLSRFQPWVRVDTASGDIFLLKTLFYLWPRQVKPSLASWSRAPPRLQPSRVAFPTAGGRARRPRSRRGRALSLVPGFRRARPAPEPPPSQPLCPRVS